VIINGRIVRAGNISQGHADVVVDGFGLIGFVERSDGNPIGWNAYLLDNHRSVPGELRAKREYAIRDVAHAYFCAVSGREAVPA
jgi:hypothetical protein